MGVYPLHTAVTVSETFSVLGTPTDPTTVTYKVKDPEGTETDYVFGVAPEVSNPSPGLYLLEFPPLSIPGSWVYEIIGTGTVEASGSGEFTILQSPVTPEVVDYPQFGPFQPWIDSQDIRGYCEIPEEPVCDLAALAMNASQIMFEVSGRQFGGSFVRSVRPCQNYANACWNNWAVGGMPWFWWWSGYSWGWGDGFGCRCSCTPLSRVLLPGYPVTEIIEVKIDGVAVSPDTWRLDKWRYLTRMRDPANPTIPQFWPACQILDLDDTESGTWSVSYRAGSPPPLAGKGAAAALACELYAAMTGGACKLPTKATKIVRQGITVDRLQPLASLLLSGGTGIAAIDTFMAAYNPGKLRRRPAIWSPDGPRFAQRYGNH